MRVQAFWLPAVADEERLRADAVLDIGLTFGAGDQDKQCGKGGCDEAEWFHDLVPKFISTVTY